MDSDKIEDVLAENLGEGFRIVRPDGELSPAIAWVDWVERSPAEGDIAISVHFDDNSEEVFEKGHQLRQIWHEDVLS